MLMLFSHLPLGFPAHAALLSASRHSTLQKNHHQPFKELAKALDSGMGDEDLAALLVQLRRDGLLAKSRNDQDTKLQTESQVICSMGLAGQSA